MSKVEQGIRLAVEALRRQAMTGVYNGRPSGMRYLESCRIIHPASGAVAIFTRDTGHHSSGWLKNPDYERCWHLSLSPIPSQIITLVPVFRELDRKVKRLWIDAAFGDHLRYVWAESPKSPEGIARDVWHWRLFCDEHWQPILPRKEVYSKDFTELGWRSASQVLAEEGYYLSETEDGRQIESTVDPT